MKKIKFILIIACFALSNQTLAKKDTYQSILFNWNNIGSSFLNQVPGSPVTTFNGYSSLRYKTKTLNSYVKFWLRTEDIPIGMNNFTAVASLQIIYYLEDPNGSLQPAILVNNQTVSINYDNTTGVKYKNVDLVNYPNAAKIEVKVLDMKVNGIAATAAQQSFINLQSFIEHERYYNYYNVWGGMGFFPILPIPIALPNINNNEITISWNAEGNAEGYELEYTFVDDYSNTGLTSFLTPSQIDFSFRNNSTKILLEATSYTMPIVEEHGYLVFRVRGYGMAGPDFDRIFYGIQNANVAGNQTFNMATYPYFFKVDNNWTHTNDKINWQSITTFAEEGKSKTVVSYMDGTMRNRQTVSSTSTEREAIIAETIYDYQGRPALNILPVPIDKPALKYYANFNQNLQGQPYTAADFDRLGNSNCVYDINPLKQQNSIGAGNYYSKYNPNKTQFNAFIPEAEGYPFTRVTYMPDPTDRVVQQGNVGEIFQPGKTINSTNTSIKNPTKYYYGKPNQQELDRLFGTNVGYAEFYQKNLVADPNGQSSVSYVDLDGKTIATALAGKAPNGIDSLESNSSILLKVNLFSSADFVDNINHSITSSQSFTVSDDGMKHNFSYDIKENVYNALSCNDNNYCLDCIYDLEIKLVNDECGTVIYQSTKTIGKLTNLNFLCNDANAMDNFSFDATLNKGSHTISRKLVVNKQAAEFYADSILKDPNNNCLKTFNTFFNEAWSKRDTTRCKEACVTCQEDAQTAENATLIANAVRECDSLWCNPQIATLCGIASMSMINDLSPGGQYAIFQDASGNTNFGYSPISIFNSSSAGINSLYSPNLESLPLLSSIQITLQGNPTFPLSHYKDNPDSLLKLINNWPEDLSEKLLPFHPEYCYLKFCKQQFVQDGNSFDTKYMNIDSYASAQNQLGSWISSTNINSFYTHDPFYLGLPASLQSQMASRFSNYTGQNTPNSIVQLAVFLANCPSGNNINTCNGAWGDGINDDAEWEKFTSSYFSLKQEFIQKAREEYVQRIGCCGNQNIGCIAAQNCNLPFIWGNPSPNCSINQLALYGNAEKRFLTINDINFPGIPNPTESIYDMTPQELADYIQSDSLQSPCPSCPELDAFKMMIWDLSNKKLFNKGGSIKADALIGLKDSLRQRFLGSQANENITISRIGNIINIVGNNCSISFSADTTINWDKADILPTCLEIKDYRNAKLHIVVNGEYKTVLNLTSTCDIFYCYGTPPSPPKPDNDCKCDSAYNNRATYQIGNIISYKNICFIVKKINKPYGLTPGIDPGNKEYWEKVCDQLSKITTSGIKTSKETDVTLRPLRYIPESNCGCNNLCDVPLPSPEIEKIPCDSILKDIATQQAVEAYSNYRDSVYNTLLHSYYAYCMNAIETFKMEYQNAEYHYTLYYYDQSGNLVRTVPPAGVKPFTTQTDLNVVANNRTSNGTPHAPNHLMTTTYRYNSLNAVVWQKTPDAGISNFFYDKLGRIALSQNAKQVNLIPSQRNSSYTLYDKLGRTVEVGEVTTGALASTVLKTNAFSFSYANWINFITTKSRSEITKTFYDSTYLPKINIAFGTAGQQYLRNRIGTVALFKDGNSLAGNDYSHATHYSYDIAGNVTDLLQDFGTTSDFGTNPDNVKTQSRHINYQFDLVSGKVNRVNYQPGMLDQFIHKYQYNADNKLTHVFSSSSGLIWENDARYFYYRHGPLARTEYGTDRVQGVDMAYTLQGWIKGANGKSESTSADIGRDGENVGSGNIGYGQQNKNTAPDVFSYWLGYHTDDYVSIANGQSYIPLAINSLQSGNYHTTPANLFNGNIRSMYTYLQPFGGLGMHYKYDQLNRIKKQDAFDFATGTLMANNAYSMDLRYDPNGNIQMLLRNGTVATPTMDNLKYHYYNDDNTIYQGNPTLLNATNRLAYVTDAISTASTDDIENQPIANYKYDAIGNLIKDLQEGITIDWNIQNKITFIKKTNNKDIRYNYDALGNRIKKEVSSGIQGVGGLTQYYVRDAQGNTLAIYEMKNDSLHWTEQHIYGSSRLGILKPENNMRISNTAIIPLFSANTKRNNTEYELTNHLGNLLATITDSKDGNNGSTLTTSTDYYAFGMKLQERNYNLLDYKSRFGYQNSEKDNDIINTENIYVTKFRFLDSRLGRWWSIDPEEKKSVWSSPYISMENNPIQNNDPNGDICIPCATAIAGGTISLGFNIYSQINEGSFDLFSGKTWLRMTNASLTGALAGSGLGGLLGGTIASTTGEYLDQIIVGKELDKSKIVAAGIVSVAGGGAIKALEFAAVKTGLVAFYKANVGNTTKLIQNGGLEFVLKSNKTKVINNSRAAVGLSTEITNNFATSYTKITDKINNKFNEYEKKNEVKINSKYIKTEVSSMPIWSNLKKEPEKK